MTKEANKGAKIMTTPPAYIVSRIDAAIRTGILPIDGPCTRTRALAAIGCMPRSGSYTAEQAAEWITANRVATSTPDRISDWLYRESILRDELDAAEELAAISPACAARMRPVVEIETDLDTVRDQIDALAPIAIAA